jgi:putative transposase
MLLARAMTAPRQVFPGRFLFISRRCTQRQFLMRPDAETNNAFTYLLAEAAQRCEMDTVLSQMMSNHHHGMVYDPHGREVEYREHFHKMFAKSQNALRGRWENLWAAEEPSVIEVTTREDLLDKLVYIATNPVKDGLVEKVHHWPGPKFVNALLTGKAIKATRPKHFFLEDGPMPLEVELALKLPDDFPDKAEFLAELRRRIAAVGASRAGTSTRAEAIVAREPDEPRTATRPAPPSGCAQPVAARHDADAQQGVAGRLP